MTVPRETPFTVRRLLLATSAALVAALLYLGALDNPFVYDDYDLIVQNATLKDLSAFWPILLHNITRPLVNVSYALDTAIWGLRPFGYHLTNLVLHALNVMLVFRLALSVCEDRGRQSQGLRHASSPSLMAFATALLFAVHPMMTEAVGYATGRSEVLYGCLFLTAFFAGRRWMLSGGIGSWLACVLLWMAGLLVKETAAMLPFVLLVYDRMLLDAPPAERKRRLWGMQLPLLGMTILALVVRIAVLQFVQYGGFRGDWRFGLVAVDAFWRYLGLFALPRDQAVFHSMQMPGRLAALRLILEVAALAALPFFAWWLQRIHSGMAFGSLWFLMLMLPSSGLFTLGVGEPLSERRAYVAAAGLFLAWGTAFEMMWQRVAARRAMRWMLATVAVLFIVQLSLRTLMRLQVWSDPVALAEESVRLSPKHWYPWMLLGDAFRHVDRCDQAIDAYREVLNLRPEEEAAWIKLGGCFIDGRRFAEAREAMMRLRAVDPASQEAAMNLGVLSLIDGDVAAARHEFEAAMARVPGQAEARQVEARQMLAFLDGSLPADEHRALCRYFAEIRAGFDLAVCRQG